jgi:prepilin-type N-terminal cleavage/methylation domain-containing protein
MIRKRLKGESGYSLVEVMASIIILAIAIIPMVGMFDMGLHSATTGSNYDKARALANANLEAVSALSYSDAKETYTPLNATPAGTPVDCSDGVFTCEVTTTYVDDDFAPAPTSINKMLVEVTVEWPTGNSFATTGLKTR